MTYKYNEGITSLGADVSMRILFIFVWVIVSSAVIHAHTVKTSTIIDNTTMVLTKFGWQDKIKIISTSADGQNLSAQFVSADAEAFVLNALRQSKDFKRSNGIMLNLFHRGAKKSFREINRPSMHIILYENRIEIHFDLHCTGLKRPLESIRHFREVLVNFWRRPKISQKKVALAFQDNL